ncbi:D-glycero-alpha-D-manno-heptose-1,7-bisphosphate 7-phosphatase [Terasakiella pusilla]|uniref:D-glycero-alpha-D-manno-heptose-1,7-bisphosphate 7-phosphatase n=1 Tax=Terasakiella pusilla TaxID=64973 RepID=UPI003AA7B6C8
MSQAHVNVGVDQIWSQIFDTAHRFSSPRPALFLDRDGVIVEEVHYLHKVEDVKLIDGAAALIAKANAQDIPVIVVTNQSGLARQMFGWDEFDAVQARMLDLLKSETGAFVDGVYACPFHKSGHPPFVHPDHEARKPNPGMLLRALDVFPIDKGASWIIGDKAGDLKAGKNAGLCGGVHVLTGHGRDEGETENARSLASSTFNVRMENSIKDALDLF